MTVNINKPQINLREQLKKLERPTTDRLAVKGADGVLIDKLSGELSLQSVEAVTGGSAVDVFVYDTSKDSDGGAWRKRTSYTSWYNETLNTAIRGSRKEFPAVVVIVGESNKVTIYDGDDPDMPMWMEFISTSGQYGAIYNGRSPISIVAKNGEIFHADSVDSVVRWNFITDTIKSESSSGRWNSNRNIADRNPSDGTNLWKNYNSVATLIGYPLYDIAVTVLPSAPINSSTGLPIPTIAVATNSGASFIRDDGNVYDYTFSSQNGSKVWEITFDENHQVNMLLGYSNVYPYTCYQAPVPSADTSLTSITNNRLLTNATFNFNQIAYKADNTPGDQIDHFIDSKYFGTTHGLSFLTPNRNNIGGQMLANITTEFNSGWMQGNIQGAFLSDTDTTDAIEYVQNGYFNNNVNHWTIGTTGTTATLNANRLLLTAPTSGSSWGYVYQGITTEIGKTYKVSLKYDRGTVDGRIVVRNDYSNTTAGALFYADLGTSNDGKTYYNTFTATATTTYILLYAKNTSGGTSAYDAVSVTLEKDRSVNNKGLNVIGTITKQPVATGADLVAYSGFSTSNKLENAGDYDFGVGNSVSLCIIGWFKITNISSYSYIMSVYDSGTDRVAGLAINASGHSAAGALYTYDNITSQLSGTTTVNDGKWHCAVGIFDGPNRKIYLDGKLEVSNMFTSYNLDIADVDKLVVGRYAYNDSYNFLGSLALTRISKSIPSPEQVKKMYEDEKHLFQENAKCALYGSSDPVTALGYDATTDILHVGTSSGRSEFKGLRRVSNTTTGVTTAISASNGLVAEQ